LGSISKGTTLLGGELIQMYTCFQKLRQRVDENLLGFTVLYPILPEDWMSELRADDVCDLSKALISALFSPFFAYKGASLRRALVA